MSGERWTYKHVIHVKDAETGQTVHHETLRQPGLFNSGEEGTVTVRPGQVTVSTPRGGTTVIPVDRKMVVEGN